MQPLWAAHPKELGREQHGSYQDSKFGDKFCFKQYFVLAKEKKCFWSEILYGNFHLKIMKTSWAIKSSKLGFMERLTNPLLEQCGWEHFKKFSGSIIDHNHALPRTRSWEAAGRRPAVSN